MRWGCFCPFHLSVSHLQSSNSTKTRHTRPSASTPTRLPQQGWRCPGNAFCHSSVLFVSLSKAIFLRTNSATLSGWSQPVNGHTVQVLSNLHRNWYLSTRENCFAQIEQFVAVPSKALCPQAGSMRRHWFGSCFGCLPTQCIPSSKTSQNADSPRPRQTWRNHHVQDCRGSAWHHCPEKQHVDLGSQCWHVLKFQEVSIFFRSKLSFESSGPLWQLAVWQIFFPTIKNRNVILNVEFSPGKILAFFDVNT